MRRPFRRMLSRVFLMGAFMASGPLLPRPVGSPNAQAGETPDLAPFVPTPQEVVEKMLEMAQVGKNDIVYDLGSGDGRIVITAAKKYGARAVGFEVDPNLIQQSRDTIRKEGLQSHVEIRNQDATTADLSPATVVTLYLLPSSNLKLRPTLWKQMKPGSRVVSHDFDMGDWKPLRVEKMNDNSGLNHTLYLWRIGDRR